jgi:hypothetical protein
MKPRWEGDERGHGLADASAVVNDLKELEQLASSPDWVAEDPERHLLPHLAQACAAPDSSFVLLSSAVDHQGRLVVDLRCRNAAAGAGELRDAVIGLVGKIAETATFIRQNGNPLSFDVLTGEVSSDGSFASHGHTLTLRIVAQ